MESQRDIAAAAHEYLRRGLPIIPLYGKVPAITHWQEFVADRVNTNFWFGPARGCNIGLRTGESGYLVIDTDTEEAEKWVQTHCPTTPMQAVSGAGSKHHYFAEPPRKEIRNRQALRGIPGLDVRGHRGFIVLAPSLHPETQRPYAWRSEILAPAALPRFAPAWVYRRTRKRLLTVVADAQDEHALLRRGQKYVDTFEPACSGENGHTKTFVAALKIAKFTNKDPELTWQLLCYYSATKCTPAWDEKALRHKWSEGLRKAR